MKRFKITDIEPIRIPVDGSLDLHAFSPKDVVSVMEEYIRECLKKDIYEVKIIHGKGRGVLLRRVHSFLEKNPQVQHYTLDPGASGWGATQVILKKGLNGLPRGQDSK